MKVACVTTYDATNIEAFAGRCYYMIQSLKNQFMSLPITYLECDQPIVIWADSPLAGVIDFYPELSRRVVCKETTENGLANERAALNRCSLVIYPSDWSAQKEIIEFLSA